MFHITSMYRMGKVDYYTLTVFVTEIFSHIHLLDYFTFIYNILEIKRFILLCDNFLMEVSIYSARLEFAHFKHLHLICFTFSWKHLEAPGKMFKRKNTERK